VVDTAGIGLGEVRPDVKLFCSRRAARESLEGKYTKSPTKKLWKNHPEKFGDAIFNFHMDRTDPESVDAAVRVQQYTGKSALGLNVLAETYELPPTTLWRANQAFVKTLDLSSVPWPWKKEQVLSWAKLFVKHELPLELHKTGTVAPDLSTTRGPTKLLISPHGSQRQLHQSSCSLRR